MTCTHAGVRAVRAWTQFVSDGDEEADAVRPEILSSWQLSGVVSPAVTHAPLADEGDTAEFWNQSPLQTAVTRVQDELRRTAEDGDLVIAVTDEQTRILWTYGGRVMRRKAETVNFVPGGRWDEASVGTNALAIAGRTGAPSMVFSAEHYAEVVHNWVCWAAPVFDPVTGRPLGVIDLSTTWDRTHPIGLATARVMARLIEGALPADRRTTPLGAAAPDEPGLTLTLLGTAEVWLDGQRLLLNRRQTEILALLAMHPGGLSVEHLHSLLYGDSAVTTSTLKAEVSHLRAALAGQLSSRPYKLTLPVTTDVEEVQRLLRRGDVRAAVRAYGGDLLPGTESPALVQMGDYLAVSVREALLVAARPRRGPALQRPRALRHGRHRGVPRLAPGAPPGGAAAQGQARRRPGLVTPTIRQPARPRFAPVVTRLTLDLYGSGLMTKIELTVDGAAVSDDVEPRMLLVQYLREKLGKTGTVIGCDTSNCGACTVHLDGTSVKSCNVLAVQANGRTVTTIEGLADTAEGDLHPVQEAFRECHGLQCGFCTPGMMMQAVDLLGENPNPTEEEVRLGMEGNLCRCTGYHNIVKSVLHAAETQGAKA